MAIKSVSIRIEEEMLEKLGPMVVGSEQSMSDNLRSMIELIKSRREEDNISAALIHVY